MKITKKKLKRLIKEELILEESMLDKAKTWFINKLTNELKNGKLDLRYFGIFPSIDDNFDRDNNVRLRIRINFSWFLVPKELGGGRDGGIIHFDLNDPMINDKLRKDLIEYFNTKLKFEALEKPGVGTDIVLKF